MSAIPVLLSIRPNRELPLGRAGCALATAAGTPMGTAIWTVGIFLGLCFVLTPALGFRGVAVSNVLAYSSEAVLLYALLRWKALI
jgi:hypothetical protein